ncbi:LysR family transcriptional regulator [Acinetobacter guillouiae]|uniref:LysR family transcriptional regulator n=1 Tax=Acinetobacter guillouiae TaxID=106649 RepID=UPI002FDA1E7A
MTINKVIDMYSVQVFIAVAGAGSMSGGASMLGISQSAVSQIIRQLEEKIGVVLIDRTNRPLILTPFGIVLKNRGILLCEAISNLKAQILEAGQGVNPDLYVGFVDSFASTCGSQITKQLINTTSRLSILTGLSPQLNEGLLRRELDMIVTSDPLMDTNNVIRHKLLTEQYLVITPPEFSKSIHSIEDIKELANKLSFIRFNKTSQVGMQIERYLRRIDLRMSNRLELDNADALTSMVADGIGWAITTPMCLLQGAYAGKVVAHAVNSMNLQRSLYLVTRRDEYPYFFEKVIQDVEKVLKASFLPKLKSLHPNISHLINIGD